ncbi:MAG: helix-turn-helix transcriptional regulator [Archangium sp.]
MLPTPNLGSFIRTAREGKKLSLRALAEIVDIAPAFQSDIEHGRRYPSPDVLERTAKALGVKVEEMKAADTRVQRDLKEWLQQNPGVQALLKDFQKSGRSGEELVAAWRKVLARKRP